MRVYTILFVEQSVSTAMFWLEYLQPSGVIFSSPPAHIQHQRVDLVQQPQRRITIYI
jgi:hypothetical protein